MKAFLEYSMNVIESINNDNIKMLRKLYDKKYRYANKMYIAEGITLVESILDKSLLHSIYIKASLNNTINTNLYACNVYLFNDNVFDKSVETVNPSGVIAIVRMQENIPVSPSGNSIILDRISDPGNLGTIIRTAIACEYEDVYLINCTDPYSGKVVRSSMGGIFNVRLHNIQLDDVPRLLNESEIIALDMSGVNIFNYKPSGKIALIVGNEANGVDKKLIKLANRVLSLPMSGKAESLNAAVASGIGMYLLGGVNNVRT